MNSEASPEYVGATQATVLENLLPRPGKVVLRGPISSSFDVGVAAYSRIIGVAKLGSNMLLNFNTSTLREATGTTVAAGAGAVLPKHRPVALGDFSYTPGSKVTGPVRWDGAGAAVALVNGPSNSADIVVHLSRLFSIGDVVGGFDEPNHLKWSDQGGAPADTAAEWQDDVSGLTNLITVGEDDDDATALGHVGKQLAIFKQRSIWLLAGLTPSSFSVQRVSSEWGCLSAESVVDHDDGCFFLSERGFAYFDGASVVDVSADVKTDLLIALSAYDGISGTERHFARAAAIGRDCVMLVIGRENTDTTVVPTIDFAAVYDSVQRTWSRFSSDAFVTGAPVYLIPTPVSSSHRGATLGYDPAGNLLYLNDLVAPEQVVPALDGHDTVDGVTADIPATSYSRIVPLASPTRSAQIKRLLLDYSFVVVSDADSSIDAWSVSLVDGLGNVLLAPTPVQATVLASGYTEDQRRAALVRKRFQVEVFADAAEAQLRITLPALDSDVTEVIASEIHDAHIEYEAGRDRPTS